MRKIIWNVIRKRIHLLGFHKKCIEYVWVARIRGFKKTKMNNQEILGDVLLKSYIF